MPYDADDSSGDSELQPFNPLDKRNLGESVADALLTRPVEDLPPTKRFCGAGVYAIYYSGDFPAYDFIRERNGNEKWALPIYVGKAVPKGARKGVVGLDFKAGNELIHRLREHAVSIEAAQLGLANFKCRYLVVEDIWIPLGESLLIQKFLPLWNVVVEGFGNHTPGNKRFAGKRSPWDMLHPGRAWAGMCAPNTKTSDAILAEIRDFRLGKFITKSAAEIVREEADADSEN